MTAEIEMMNADIDVGLGEKFLELCSVIEAAPRPTVVVMQERGSHPEYSAHVGEIMAAIFQRVGAVGVVTDAAVRDLAEIKALGFHCFTSGVVAGYGGSRILNVQSIVNIGGLRERLGVSG